MTGQGTIVATGSIAYPAEWAHAQPGPDQGAGRLEGDDDDLDLRPPGHPGRRVGLVPAPDRAAAAGRGRLLRGRRRRSGQARSSPGPPRLRLGAAAGRRRPRRAVTQRNPSEELLQAVQAATSLLKAYRTHGHLAAHLDPLGSEPKGDPAIQPENLNLTPELMAQIPASILRIGVPGETLLDALPRMREAYCGTIGLPDRAPLLAPAAGVAAGDDRDRRPPPAAHRRREAPAARPPDRRLPVRALHPEGLPGPEDVLGRGARCDRPDARRDRDARASATAPRRSSSGWPTAAGSASSPTTSGARWSRSSPSSRARRRSTP